jgi:hypothetical protein
MRIDPKNDTFDGQFTLDFSGDSARSNTRGLNAPSVVAEPSTLVVLLASGALLIFWRRRPRFRGEAQASR